MSSFFPLRQSLQDVQQKMSADFSYASARVEQRGPNRYEREALILKEYLSRYLPKTVVAVQGGEIVDSEGNRSRQCDVVIEDPGTPSLWVSETYQIIPVEWAHGVIEVKHNLTSTGLILAHRNILAAKSLRKLTYDPDPPGISFMMKAYGRHFGYYPMYGVLFAYSGSSLSSLGEKLWELQRDTPIESWIDLVVVLDQGLLTYSDPSAPEPDALAVRPSPGSALRVLVSPEALTPATLLMQMAFSQVFMTPAMLNTYFGPEDWGTPAESFGPE